MRKYFMVDWRTGEKLEMNKIPAALFLEERMDTRF